MATVILKLEETLEIEDTEVLIRYAQMNHDVERLVALIQSTGKRIQCDADGSAVLVHASDIFYIESVDKRTFVYCEKEVYRTEYRLYQLMEELRKLGFTQISKSCLLNVRKLKAVRQLPNSRMEALLVNDERIFVTWKYFENIKQALQEGAFV